MCIFHIVMTTMEVQRHGDIDWERYKPQILDLVAGTTPSCHSWTVLHTQNIQIKYLMVTETLIRQQEMYSRDQYTVIEETTH